MAKTARVTFLALSMGVILLGGLTDANAARWKSKRIDVVDYTGWTQTIEAAGRWDTVTILKLPVTVANPTQAPTGCKPLDGAIAICFNSLGALGPDGWTQAPVQLKSGNIERASITINSDHAPYLWSVETKRWVVMHEMGHALAHLPHVCRMSSVMRECSDGITPLPQYPDQGDIDAINAAYGAVKALSQP